VAGCRDSKQRLAASQPERGHHLASGKMIFADGEDDLDGRRDDVLALVSDTLSKQAQILVFENSRRNAESAASRLCNLTSPDPKAKSLAQMILATGESETCRRLANCVACGVAFHHAGLLPEQRRLVEQGFRENLIKVIACTPTLAAGLNLPARRVLIKSYKRYEYGSGMVPIPVIEYRQMSGRAGRPGLDPYGESFLIAKTIPRCKTSGSTISTACQKRSGQSLPVRARCVHIFSQP